MNAINEEKMEALLNEYSKLYTCAVSDAIDELGFKPGFIDAGVRPMWPGARILGYAGTMKMEPSEEPLDRNIIAKLIKFIRKTPKFPIMCVDMEERMIAAGLGQSTSRLLQGLGFRGGLVNGPIRDLSQVIALNFPIFARGIVCSSIRGRMNIDLNSVMKPVNCGERIITPRDLIFGDINGVVIVEQNNIESVLTKAKEIISTDKWWFEQLEQGRKPEDIEKEKPLP